MRQPKFKYGDVAINTQTNIRVRIKKPIFEKSILRKHGRATGFLEEFTGEYYCSWIDDKGELVYGNLLESILSLTQQ